MKCNITCKGMQSISEGNLVNLRSLQLLYNEIGNLGIKWLIKANLPNL